MLRLIVVVRLIVVPPIVLVRLIIIRPLIAVMRRIGFILPMEFRPHLDHVLCPVSAIGDRIERIVPDFPPIRRRSPRTRQPPRRRLLGVLPELLGWSRIVAGFGKWIILANQACKLGKRITARGAA